MNYTGVYVKLTYSQAKVQTYNSNRKETNVNLFSLGDDKDKNKIINIFLFFFLFVRRHYNQ